MLTRSRVYVLFGLGILGCGAPEGSNAEPPPSVPDEVDTADQSVEATAADEVGTSPDVATATAADPTTGTSGPALELELERRPIPLAGLSAELVRGAPLHETPWDVGGASQHGVANRSTGERFTILVRAHGDESLQSFRRNHERWTFEPVIPIEVCGRPARRLRAARTAEHLACVIREGGRNSPAYIPLTEIDVVELEHRGLTVLFSVEVASDSVEAYRETVDRVLASIRCDA